MVAILNLNVTIKRLEPDKDEDVLSTNFVIREGDELNINIMNVEEKE